MQNPTVSFVVPCYKLAHLLPECVNSIQSQTYTDFEVLIMDDCSPDNTAEVANSFRDHRIKYIRNDQNLGNLRNYNKGIGLSRGKYVWLISADDYLRRPYILQRYVELMEKHPRVGYTFCPGVSVKNGQETRVLSYSVYGRHDEIVDGRALLKELLTQTSGKRLGVVAASAMARRECYEKVSLFPLDAGMEWSGDWYLWCAFALFFDVGYFAEPMVCYREHDLSMTSFFTRQEKTRTRWAGDIAVPCMIRRKANELGLRKISKDCLVAVASEYVRHCASMSVDQFEESLYRSTESEKERKWVRARFLERIADDLWSRGDFSLARKFYLLGLKNDSQMVKPCVKLLFLAFGKPGHYLRALLRHFRGVVINYVYETYNQTVVNYTTRANATAQSESSKPK